MIILKIMAWIALGCFGLLMIGGKFAGPPTPEQMRERISWNLAYEARTHMQKQARDPASVVFGTVRAVLEPRPIVCGEINGRNGFGGMTGMQRFMYLPAGQVGIIDEGNRATRASFEENWRASCRNIPT